MRHIEQWSKTPEQAVDHFEAIFNSTQFLKLQRLRRSIRQAVNIHTPDTLISTAESRLSKDATEDEISELEIFTVKLARAVIPQMYDINDFFQAWESYFDDVRTEKPVPIMQEVIMPNLIQMLKVEQSMPNQGIVKLLNYGVINYCRYPTHALIEQAKEHPRSGPKVLVITGRNDSMGYYYEPPQRNAIKQLDDALLNKGNLVLVEYRESPEELANNINHATSIFGKFDIVWIRNHTNEKGAPILYYDYTTQHWITADPCDFALSVGESLNNATTKNSQIFLEGCSVEPLVHCLQRESNRSIRYPNSTKVALEKLVVERDKDALHIEPIYRTE